MISRIAFRLFPSLFYDKDGCPIRCPECGSSHIVDKVEDMIDACYGPVSEMSYACGGCMQLIGYWAYGSYDPAFSRKPPLRWVLRGGTAR